VATLCYTDAMPKQNADPTQTTYTAPTGKTYTHEQIKRHKAQQRYLHQLRLTEDQRSQLQQARDILESVGNSLEVTVTLCDTCQKVSYAPGSKGNKDGSVKISNWIRSLQRMLRPALTEEECYLVEDGQWTEREEAE
jgi:hypothetical protein